MNRAFIRAFLVSLLLASQSLLCFGETGAKVDQGSSAIESKLLGDWKGGACQGDWTFRANGTFELDHYSPANLHLSGTWKMRWDALPPTLIATFSSGGDSQLVGKKWDLKVTRLDQEILEFQIPGSELSRCERSKK